MADPTTSTFHFLLKKTDLISAENMTMVVKIVPSLAHNELPICIGNTNGKDTASTQVLVWSLRFQKGKEYIKTIVFRCLRFNISD